MNPQSTNPFDNEAPDDVLERAIASHQAETVPPGPPSPPGGRHAARSE